MSFRQGHSGIRDINLLESALARPQHLQTYRDPPPDITALAAAYAFGIARNHAFVDGNNRTSYVVTRTFVVLDGYDVTAQEITRLEIWTRLGDGSMNEEDIAEWLRSNIAKP